MSILIVCPGCFRQKLLLCSQVLTPNKLVSEYKVPKVFGLQKWKFFFLKHPLEIKLLLQESGWSGFNSYHACDLLPQYLWNHVSLASTAKTPRIVFPQCLWNQVSLLSNGTTRRIKLPQCLWIQVGLVTTATTPGIKLPQCPWNHLGLVSTATSGESASGIR